MSTALKIGVIIGYIAIISFIATYLGKGTKTFKDFAIGGSKIPWYIMGGTLFSTFCGGATMVAYVGNFYSQGLIWIWIPVQVVLVGVIYLFLYKKVFNLRQISTADIMALRYGEKTRLGNAQYLDLDGHDLCRLLASCRAGARLYSVLHHRGARRL